MGAARKIFISLVVGQFLVAATVIGLVAARLSNIEVAAQSDPALPMAPDQAVAPAVQTCLLGYAEDGTSLCNVAYGVGVVSIVASAALALLMHFTWGQCSMGLMVDAIVSAAGTAWWAVAGALLSHYAHQPSVYVLQQAGARDAVAYLSWVGCSLFGLMFAFNTGLAVSLFHTCSRGIAGSSDCSKQQQQPDLESCRQLEREISMRAWYRQPEPVLCYPADLRQLPTSFPAVDRKQAAAVGHHQDELWEEINLHTYWGTAAARF